MLYEVITFHGYYDHYCYLPLYVFCGQAMLCCVLRRSRIDGAKQAAALIKLVITSYSIHYTKLYEIELV